MSRDSSKDEPVQEEEEGVRVRRTTFLPVIPWVVVVLELISMYFEINEGSMAALVFSIALCVLWTYLGLLWFKATYLYLTKEELIAVEPTFLFNEKKGNRHPADTLSVDGNYIEGYYSRYNKKMRLPCRKWIAHSGDWEVLLEKIKEMNTQNYGTEFPNP